jgi:imidazolonepropionase-like amidohydrolase
MPVAAYRAGQVFDGERALGPATVVVDDGSVREVTPAAVPGAVDLGDDVTLLPGLIDPHVHLGFDCSHDLVAGMEVDDDAVLRRMRASAQAMLAAGITTIRDLGDRGFLTRRLAASWADGPTLLSSGPPLTTPRGHCWFLGGEVDGLDAMLRAVEERAAQGCDTVKVMVSGGNITPGSSPFEPQFRLAELREVVGEAHRLGLLAAAHVHAPLCVGEALDAGFDSLEHVTFMTPEGVEADPEVLRRIADSGVVVSITAGLAPGGSPPPAVAARLDAVREVMATLHHLGARMVASSDGGISPAKRHEVLPYAVGDLALMGFSPVEALRAVTARSAEVLGLGGRKGVLAAGADADLVVVAGDPTRDVAALHDVREVLVGGRSAVTAHR